MGNHVQIWTIPKSFFSLFDVAENSLFYCSSILSWIFHNVFTYRTWKISIRAKQFKVLLNAILFYKNAVLFSRSVVSGRLYLFYGLVLSLVFPGISIWQNFLQDWHLWLSLMSRNDISEIIQIFTLERHHFNFQAPDASKLAHKDIFKL